MRALCLVTVSLVLLAGCGSLSQMEKQQYTNLIDQGAEPITDKEPVVAALLNLAPGIGDIYTGHWGVFVLDLLLWPYSAAWAVPQGAITASNMNKHATIAYYTVGPGMGKFNPDSWNPDSSKVKR